MASPNKLSPIPHPPKKPVVGNMLSLDPNAPVQHLVRLTKELGPIFWLDMMGAPLVIVSGPRGVREMRMMEMEGWKPSHEGWQAQDIVANAKDIFFSEEQIKMGARRF